MIPSTSRGSRCSRARPRKTDAAPSFYSPGVDPATYYGFVHYDYERVTNDAVTARVEHDFDDGLRFVNQARSDATARQIEATSPSGSVTAAPAGQASLTQAINQTKNRIISDQATVVDNFETGSLAHALTAGLEVSRETADNPAWALVPSGFASPAYLVSIYTPLNFPVALPNYAPHPTGTRSTSRINTGALDGFDTVKPNRFWEVVGGLRLEHYRIDDLILTAAAPAIPAAPAGPATPLQPATAATPASAAVARASADPAAARTTASFRAGLVYKPVPEGSLYVAYATSVRPPGSSNSINSLSSSATSADNPLRQPEIGIDAEAGAKWTFLRDRLLATAGVFRTVNTNVPATDPITGLVNQTSDQTVQGVEISASGKITDAWLVLAAYARMEASVSNEISTNTQGLTLPLLAKNSGNLWTTYRQPSGFTFGSGLQYRGETERLQATTTPTATTFANSVPAVWLVNAMASFSTGNRLTLRLNVNNLTNRAYVASLSASGYRANLGAPRSYLLTAEFRF
jgi:catecholate siderophore receptor